MSVKFDRFRLSIPNSAITILKPDEFTHTVSKDGMETHLKYEQKMPFYYLILVDLVRNRTYVEFSGKALLDNYPQLIQSNNIEQCLVNINSYRICNIVIDEAVATADVCQCDVTADVTFNGSFKDLASGIIMKNSRQYTIPTITANRFTIQNTVTTNRKRERLIIYDKAEDMRRKVNQQFLSVVNNANEQWEYFANKARFELNLNSLDRIRKYLGVTDASLLNVLHSHSDPILMFLQQSLGDDSNIDILKHHTPKLRMLEHLLLLCLCDFDLQKLEVIVRDTTGSKNSITNTMIPFKNIYQSIICNCDMPKADIDFIQLQELLKRAVRRYLIHNNSTTDSSLLSLYQKSVEDTTVPMPYDYFNLPYVNLPLLPVAG